MVRTLALAGAVALLLPSFASAQDWHHRRDRHRRDRVVHHGGTGVSFRIGIGNGSTSLGIGIFSGASHTHNVVHRVHHGSRFTVLGRNGDFYLVDYGNGRRGYVRCHDLPGYVYRGPSVIVLDQGHLSAPAVIAPPVVVRRAELYRLDRFDYKRVLKHGGDLQSELSLVRLRDGRYQIDLAGAAVERRRVLVGADWVEGLRQVLSRMQAFPNASFDRGHDTFYTTFSTQGALNNGYALNMSRAFYDPSYEPSSAQLANELHATVDNLIASIAEQTGGRGFTSNFR